MNIKDLPRVDSLEWDSLIDSLAKRRGSPLTTDEMEYLRKQSSIVNDDRRTRINGISGTMSRSMAPYRVETGRKNAPRLKGRRGYRVQYTK